MSSSNCDVCQAGCTRKSTSHGSKCVMETSGADQPKTLSTTLSIMGSAMNSTTKFVMLLHSASPAAFYSGVLVNMLDYLKYLEIRYPPRLQYILDSRQDLSFSFIPDMPEYLVARFPNEALPGKFAQYGLAPSFLVNYWGSLFSLIALFAALGLICLVEHVSGKLLVIKRMCGEAKSSLKWNFILMSFLSSYGNLVLYTSLEFRTVQLRNPLSATSFSMALLISLAVIFIFVKIVYIIYQLRKTQKRGNIVENASRMHAKKEYYKDYSVLFENLKYELLMQQASVCIFTIYTFLFYVVVAYLFSHPLWQTILHLFLSILFFIYSVVYRPFIHLVDVVMSIIQQLMMVAINVCVLGLAILDVQSMEATDTRRIFGEIIIWSNVSVY